MMDTPVHKVKLPELGEGITTVTVAYWHYPVGAKVGKDDDLVEVVTDKAAFNVPAAVSGTIKEICVAEGEEASIGEVLAIIRVSP